MLLMLLSLACLLFVLFVFVAVRLVFPPVQPIMLNDVERDYIERAYRGRKSN